ncbi:lysozyme inhibitor LprI family protein [Pseudomonas sp. X10]
MKSMLWLLAILPLSAFATDDGPTPCDSVETAQQALECSVYSRNTAERQLDDAYNDLKLQAQAQFGDQPTRLKDYLQKIAIAQELWHKLREADCAAQVLGAGTTDSSAQIVLNDCMAQRSDERSEYLQSLATQTEEIDPLDD